MNQKYRKEKDEQYPKPNTRPIPILVTLAAAGISCVISILRQASLKHFVSSLLITVIIFGILGSLVRVFLDLGFKADKSEVDKKASEAEDAEAAESDEADEKDHNAGDQTQE